MSFDPHILLGIVWAGYFSLHSLLADLRVKAWAQRIMGTSYRYYRLLYNGMALLLLWPLLSFQDTFSSPLIIHFPGQKVLAGILGLTGLLIIYIAFRNYSTKSFLGLTDPSKENGGLATQGLHAYTRHPLYFGTIIFLLGYLLYAARLSSAVIVGVAFLYLYVGTLLEEKKLVAQFGEAYLQYKKEVKMLIPFVF